MSKKTGDFYAYNIRIFDYNKEKYIIFFGYIEKSCIFAPELIMPL